MAQFSARDYVWLASTMRQALCESATGDRPGVVFTIGILTDALASNNPSGFDPDLFLRNCGLADREGNINPNAR